MTDKEKFSPGPWTYDGGFTVFSKTGLPVCDLVSDAKINGEIHIFPYKENAALIAAAPDMYDALRWACFYNCKRPVFTANCEKCKINQALTMAGGEKWYRKVKNDNLRD